MGIPALPIGNMPIIAAAGGPIPLSLVLLLIYCVLIAFSSMCGGALPTLIRLTHTQMQLVVSLVGGLMLGVGIFHQLPHAVAAMPKGGAVDSHALDLCMLSLMVGLLLTFFMLRMFHFHSHEPIEAAGDQHHDCSQNHDHDGHHDHGHGDAGAVDPPKKASWIGIFLGLSLHTVLDGVALAAHVDADALHRSDKVTLLGVGTFLGVVLHKPLDSLSITSLLAHGGWSRRAMIIVNIVYALMCPIGAMLFYFGIQNLGEASAFWVALALAMSAGVFICISLSDLLPEVQFHSHDRLWLSAALLLGVGTAWAIGLVEPAHSHDRPNNQAVRAQADPRNPE